MKIENLKEAHKLLQKLEGIKRLLFIIQRADKGIAKVECYNTTTKSQTCSSICCIPTGYEIEANKLLIQFFNEEIERIEKQIEAL